MAFPRNWLIFRYAIHVIASIFWYPVVFFATIGGFIWHNMAFAFGLAWLIPVLIWKIFRNLFIAFSWGPQLVALVSFSMLWVAIKLFFAACATLFFVVGVMHAIPLAMGGVGYLTEPIEVYQDDIFPYIEAVTQIVQTFYDILFETCATFTCLLDPLFTYINLNMEFFVRWIRDVADKIFALFSKRDVRDVAGPTAPGPYAEAWWNEDLSRIDPAAAFAVRSQVGFDCWMDPISEAISWFMHLVFDVILGVTDAILWVIATVLQGIIDLINFLIYDFIDFIENLWNDFMTFIHLAMDAVMTFVDFIVSLFTFKRYTGADAVSAMTSFLEAIIRPIVKVIAYIVDFFNNLFQNTKTFILGLISRFADVGKFFFNLIDKIKDIADAIAGFFTGVASGLNVLLHNISNISGLLHTLYDFVHGVVQNALDFFRNAYNAIKPVFDKIKDFVDTIISVVKKVKDIIDALEDFFGRDGVTPIQREFDPNNTTNCVPDCQLYQATEWIHGSVVPNYTDSAYLMTVDPYSFTDKDTNVTTLWRWLELRRAMDRYTLSVCLDVCGLTTAGMDQAIAFSPPFTAAGQNNAADLAQMRQVREKIVEYTRSMEHTTRAIERVTRAVGELDVEGFKRSVDNITSYTYDAGLSQLIESLSALNLAETAARFRELADSNFTEANETMAVGREISDAFQKIMQTVREFAEKRDKLRGGLSAMSNPAQFLRKRLQNFGADLSGFDSTYEFAANVSAAIADGSMTRNGRLDARAVNETLAAFDVEAACRTAISVATAYANAPDMHVDGMRYFRAAGHLLITATFRRSKMAEMRAVISRTPGYEGYDQTLAWIESHAGVAAAARDIEEPLRNETRLRPARSTEGEQWIADHLPGTDFVVKYFNYIAYYVVHRAMCAAPLLYCPTPQHVGVDFLSWVLYDIILCIPDTENGDYCWPMYDTRHTCDVFSVDFATRDINCRNCDHRYYVDELSYHNEFFYRHYYHYRNGLAYVGNLFRFARALITFNGTVDTTHVNLFGWQKRTFNLFFGVFTSMGFSGATFGWIDRWAGVGGVIGDAFGWLRDWTTFPAGHPDNQDFICLIFNIPSFLISVMWSILIGVFLLFLLIRGFFTAVFASIFAILVFPINNMVNIWRAYKVYRRKHRLYDAEDDIEFLLDDYHARMHNKWEKSNKAELRAVSHLKTERDMERHKPVPSTYIDEEGITHRTPARLYPRDENEAMILDTVYKAISNHEKRVKAIKGERGYAPVGTRVVAKPGRQLDVTARGKSKGKSKGKGRDQERDAGADLLDSLHEAHWPPHGAVDRDFAEELKEMEFKGKGKEKDQKKDGDPLDSLHEAHWPPHETVDRGLAEKLAVLEARRKIDKHMPRGSLSHIEDYFIRARVTGRIGSFTVKTADCVIELVDELLDRLIGHRWSLLARHEDRILPLMRLRYYAYLCVPQNKSAHTQSKQKKKDSVKKNK